MGRQDLYTKMLPLEEEKRNLRIERRAHKLLSESHLPSRMEKWENLMKNKNIKPEETFIRPKVNKVPDFERCHREFAAGMERKKKSFREQSLNHLSYQKLKSDQ